MKLITFVLLLKCEFLNELLIILSSIVQIYATEGNKRTNLNRTCEN